MSTEDTHAPAGHHETDVTAKRVWTLTSRRLSEIGTLELTGLSNGTLSVGSESADVLLDWPGIATRHVSLEDVEGTLALVAHAERTWVNEEPVAPGEQRDLRSGDKITLGPIELVVGFEETEVEQEPEPDVDTSEWIERAEVQSELRRQLGEVEVAAEEQQQRLAEAEAALEAAIDGVGQDPDESPIANQMEHYRQLIDELKMSLVETTGEALAAHRQRLGDLQKRQGELDELHNRIRTRGDMLTKREQGIEQREDAARQSEVAVDQRQSDLDRTAEEIATQSRELNEREQATWRRERELERRESEIGRHETTWQTRLAEVQSQQLDLDRVQLKLAEQLDEVSGRSARYEEEESELRQREEELARREAEVATRESKTASHESTLEEQQSIVRAERSAVEADRDRLATMRSELDERLDALQLRVDELNERETHLATTEVDLDQQRQRWALERDRQQEAADRQDAELQDREVALRNRELALEMSRDELNATSSEHSISSHEMQSQAEQLAAREQDVAQLESELAERRAELERHEAEVSESRQHSESERESLEHERAELESAKVEFAQQQADVERTRAELDVDRERMTALFGTPDPASEGDEQDADVESIHAEVESLREELASERESIAVEREHLEAQRDQLAVDRQQVDEQRDAVEGARSDLEAEQERLSEAEAAVEQERLAVAEMQQQLARQLDAEPELDSEPEEKAAEAEAEAAAVLEELARIRAERDAAYERAEALASKIEAMSNGSMTADQAVADPAVAEDRSGELGLIAKWTAPQASDVVDELVDATVEDAGEATDTADWQEPDVAGIADVAQSSVTENAEDAFADDTADSMESGPFDSEPTSSDSWSDSDSLLEPEAVDPSADLYADDRFDTAMQDEQLSETPSTASPNSDPFGWSDSAADAVETPDSGDWQNGFAANETPDEDVAEESSDLFGTGHIPEEAEPPTPEDPFGAGGTEDPFGGSAEIADPAETTERDDSTAEAPSPWGDAFGSAETPAMNEAPSDDVWGSGSVNDLPTDQPEPSLGESPFGAMGHEQTPFGAGDDLQSHLDANPVSGELPTGPADENGPTDSQLGIRSQLADMFGVSMDELAESADRQHQAPESDSQPMTPEPSLGEGLVQPESSDLMSGFGMQTPVEPATESPFDAPESTGGQLSTSSPFGDLLSEPSLPDSSSESSVFGSFSTTAGSDVKDGAESDTFGADPFASFNTSELGDASNAVSSSEDQTLDTGLSHSVEPQFTTPAAETPPESGEEAADESVAAYMERLLARSRGTEAPETPAPVATTPEPAEEAVEEQPQEPPKERQPVDAEAIRKEVVSFREVALMSARTAVAKSKVKQIKIQLLAKGIATGVGFIVSGIMLASPLWSRESFVNLGITAFVISCMLAYFTWESLMHYRRIMSVPGQSDASEADDSGDE